MKNSFLKYELFKLFRNKTFYVWIIIYPALGFFYTAMSYAIGDISGYDSFVSYHTTLTSMGKMIVFFPLIVNVFVVSFWLTENKNKTLSFLITKYKSRLKVYIYKTLFLLGLIIVFDLFVFLFNNFVFFVFLSPNTYIPYFGSYSKEVLFYYLIITIIFDIFLCAFSTFLTLGINHSISGLVLVVSIFALLGLVLITEERASKYVFMNRINITYYYVEGKPFSMERFYSTIWYGLGLSVVFYSLGYLVFRKRTLN